MKLKEIFFISLALVITLSATGGEDSKKPTVLITILVRNKAHTLPYFFAYLEQLNYPKERIHLWIQSDNNIDKSIEILTTWLKSKGNEYHGVEANFDEKSHGFENENGIAEWSTQRFLHVINLREKALNAGRNMWADFVWMLDADVFLTNPSTLDELVSKNLTVVAPLLKSDGLYSNFWAGMTSDYYYFRTEKYEPILFREETGCFHVPMIHSAVLIDLRKYASDRLTYDPTNLNLYDGPTDDIITFAIGANKSAVPMYICNENVYGFVMVPLEIDETVAEDLQRLTNIKTEILSDSNYLPVSKDLEQFVQYPAEDTLQVDNIYVINLLRRPERRDRMYRLFKELGIRAETVDAIDGRPGLGIKAAVSPGLECVSTLTQARKSVYVYACSKQTVNYNFRPGIGQKEVFAGTVAFSRHLCRVVWTLNQSVLEDLGIEMLPEYADPYHKRLMTMGEIGCFLSHYTIWNKVIDHGFDSVIILEDDVRFEPFFRQKLNYILKELEILQIEWDLVYLGRKRLVENAESWVDGSKYLVHAAYSYWTLGYILSAEGARKLVNAMPLKKLVPVDEYLPILSDAHPRDAWKSYYPERDLIILSANPLLIHPMHYTGEQGYISDTENSTIVFDDDDVNKANNREEL